MHIEHELQKLGHQDFIFLASRIVPLSVKECLGKIKRVTDTQRTRIVILTGVISQMEEHDFLGLGVTAVLEKASSYHEIRASLYHVLSGDSQQFA